MSIREELKTRYQDARLNGNKVIAAALSVVIGDIQTEESRGKVLTDDQILGKIKKQVKSNQETLQYLKSGDQRHADLTAENEVLDELLPSKLGLIGIAAVVRGANAIQQVVDAKSEGQAIGVVMKALKAAGLDGDSSEVKRLVTEIRTVPV